jgi:hypothetical protein
MNAMARDPDNHPGLKIDPRGGLRTIGAAASRLTAGLADKRGWTAARLIAHWPEIVGAELARRCLPERLVGQGRPARAGSETSTAPRRPAALRIRIAGAAALEIQHRETEIIERVNGYFGYRAIDRLQLVQGTLPAVVRRRPPAPLDASRTAAITNQVAPVRDDALRSALQRLGQAIARK